jgi:PAS domain S-box-containing protein
MRKSANWSGILRNLVAAVERPMRLRQQRWGYAVAVLAAVVPFVFRQFLAVAFHLPLPPYLLFSPIVLLVALAYGFRAGLLTTLLAALMAQYWIIFPVQHWAIMYGSDTVALAFFCSIGFFMSLVATSFRERMRRMANLEREQQLRASRESFCTLLRDSRDIIYRFNLRTHRYEYISPAVKAVLGYSPDQLSNLSFGAMPTHIHPDDRRMFVEQSKRAETFGRAEFEYRHMASDGQYRWLSVVASCTLAEDGTPLYREGFARDITEKKQSEEALLRNATLASVGRMVAAIAHEINNPLAAVTNLLFLAASDKEVPASVRGYLEQADAELQRIAHITRQTLGFYREVNAPEPVRIDALIVSAIDLFQRRIEAAHVTLVREWSEGLQVVGVGGELRQVVSNLLANSLDAVEDGGTIRIRACTRLRNGLPYMRILISDNGKGIERGLRKRIFEPFFTTKGSVGTGLGLWVTHQLVEKHGGTIRLRSATTGPWRGTLFQIDLPLEQPIATPRIAVDNSVLQPT